MPDETEPTPAASATAEERPPDRTEEHSTVPARSGVQVPKWLAVGVVAVVLAGGGFAVGRATASDNHGGFVPIGNNRPGGGPGGRGGPGGPGGFDRRGGPGGGPGGEYGPGQGGDSNSNDNGGSNANGNGGSNGSTTPSTTAGTGT